MTQAKQKIIDEIIIKIEDSKSFTETCSVICSKFQFTERTFAKYWNQANEQLSKTLQARKKAIESKTIEALEKHAEKQVLSKLKKLILLEGIALGETEFEKVFFDKGVPKKVSTKPDATDRMKAIEIHNKMTGDNEAETANVTFIQQPLFPDVPKDDRNY